MGIFSVNIDRSTKKDSCRMAQDIRNKRKIDRKIYSNHSEIGRARLK